MWEGAYSSTGAYAVGNAVSDANGSSYINIDGLNTGDPASTGAADWSLLASVGATGPQGIQGPTGSQGIQGNTGPQGDQGIQGVQGITGPQGDQGIQGNTGANGATGATGATGQGFNFAGAYGGTGTTYNPYDVTTENGSSYVCNTNCNTEDPATSVSIPDNNWSLLASVGATGPQGIQGPSGTQGIQGITGPQGDQGIQGVQGITGPQGDQGIQGNTGANGATGATGATGQGFNFAGAYGGTGTTYNPYDVTTENGSSYVCNTNCNTEDPATSVSIPDNNWSLLASIGATGPQGIQGPSGTQGVQGITGPQGDQGSPGHHRATGRSRHPGQYRSEWCNRRHGCNRPGLQLHRRLRRHGLYLQPLRRDHRERLELRVQYQLQQRGSGHLCFHSRQQLVAIGFDRRHWAARASRLERNERHRRSDGCDRAVRQRRDEWHERHEWRNRRHGCNRPGLQLRRCLRRHGLYLQPLRRDDGERLDLRVQYQLQLRGSGHLCFHSRTTTGRYWLRSAPLGSKGQLARTERTAPTE